MRQSIEYCLNKNSKGVHDYTVVRQSIEYCLNENSESLHNYKVVWQNVKYCLNENLESLHEYKVVRQSVEYCLNANLEGLGECKVVRHSVEYCLCRMKIVLIPKLNIDRLKLSNWRNMLILLIVWFFFRSPFDCFIVRFFYMFVFLTLQYYLIVR